MYIVIDYMYVVVVSYCTGSCVHSLASFLPDRTTQWVAPVQYEPGDICLLITKELLITTVQMQ